MLGRALLLLTALSIISVWGLGEFAFGFSISVAIALVKCLSVQARLELECCRFPDNRKDWRMREAKI